MRLHRLEVAAFLAFAGREAVDFDRLGAAGLFLIHGRTGAGKSALLDAVCFAFYGEVPGTRADGCRLRSDHASPELATEVVLEATLRGRRVRVTRAPEQERPKVRGTGLTTEPHRVRVVAIEPDGSERVLATRHDDARRELGDLLGMTKEQFCQVVVLPQGGFARFLHARSDERETLLRELFDVGRFADVERWLKDRKHAAERAHAETVRALRDVVSRAEELAGAAAPDGWVDEPSAAAGWLEEQLVVAEASATTADGGAAAAASARDAAMAAATAARELAARQAERARAAAELARWEERRTARDAAVAELTAARRAAPAQALLEELHVRAAAAAEAAMVAADAVAAAEATGLVAPWPGSMPEGAPAAVGSRAAEGAPAGSAPRAAEGAPAELTLFDVGGLGVAAATEPPDRAAAGTAPARPDGPGTRAHAMRAQARDLRLRAGAAEAQVEAEQALEAKERAVHALQGRAHANAADAERHRTAGAAARARRPAAEAAAVAAREAQAQLAGVEAAAHAAAAAAAAGTERDELERRLAREERDLLTARELAAGALETHAGLLERRLHGIAAELAARLVDGRPCAVCGAAEHPAPAAPPDGGLVTDDAVRTARERADAAVADRDRRTAAVAELTAAAAARRAICGDVALTELVAAADRAARDHATARDRAAGRSTAERALVRLDEEIGGIDSRLRAAEEAGAALRTRIDQALEALEGERAAVERARGGERSVAARVARLAAAAQAADTAADALDAADRASEEARRAHDRAVAAALAAGFAGAGGRAPAVTPREAAPPAPDGDAPTSPEAAALAALRSALRPPPRIAELDAAVRAWDTGLAERRTAAAREDLAEAAARPAPDLAALEAAARVAGAAADEALGAVAIAGRRHAALQDLRGRLAEALQAAVPARDRVEVTREVADLANGTSASNRLRMRLSAYVLAARLEEVAAAATVRLQRMSGGRYALEHADDGARGNRRGGLDLRVCDAWTGRDRPPSSLSGGETFLASLALALGLADVVSAEAGGARLETLFVDEGFGSLDDEGTLDEVLEVLDALRDGGRAVGIVSHVAELRQRIPVQLRIDKGSTGSRVRRPEGVEAAA